MQPSPPLSVLLLPPAFLPVDVDDPRSLSSTQVGQPPAAVGAWASAVGGATSRASTETSGSCFGRLVGWLVGYGWGVSFHGCKMLEVRLHQIESRVAHLEVRVEQPVGVQDGVVDGVDVVAVGAGVRRGLRRREEEAQEAPTHRAGVGRGAFVDQARLSRCARCGDCRLSAGRLLGMDVWVDPGLDSG